MVYFQDTCVEARANRVTAISTQRVPSICLRLSVGVFRRLNSVRRRFGGRRRLKAPDLYMERSLFLKSWRFGKRALVRTPCRVEVVYEHICQDIGSGRRVKEERRQDAGGRRVREAFDPDFWSCPPAASARPWPRTGGDTRRLSPFRGRPVGFGTKDEIVPRTTGCVCETSASDSGSRQRPRNRELLSIRR